MSIFSYNKGKVGERELAHELSRIFSVSARRSGQFQGSTIRRMLLRKFQTFTSNLNAWNVYGFTKPLTKRLKTSMQQKFMSSVIDRIKSLGILLFGSS
ncbi:MAG: hypothetical protein LBG58_06685 [Planctomycetaceae bacterium]|jgi:hypothetical protein|nr:hypothetical protein [Planctomycetaceae bacterium]